MGGVSDAEKGQCLANSKYILEPTCSPRSFFGIAEPGASPFLNYNLF